MTTSPRPTRDAPAPDWEPPATLEERLKRLLAPPRLELARITARELRRGEPELRLAPFLVDPDRLALDIGANRGIWTAVAARRARRVIAFEPNPKLYRVLAAALPANAEARRIALSDRDGEAALEVPRSARGFSNQHASLNPARNAGREVRAVTVETRRLDGLDLPPVGFMKIDVEGHEAAVVAGARALIARDRPRLVVEIEDAHAGRPAREIVGEIEALGYHALVLRAGALTPAAAHFAADPPGPGEPGYINNFVFLPHA